MNMYDGKIYNLSEEKRIKICVHLVLTHLMQKKKSRCVQCVFRMKKSKLVFFFLLMMTMDKDRV